MPYTLENNGKPKKYDCRESVGGTDVEGIVVGTSGHLERMHSESLLLSFLYRSYTLNL